MPDGLPRQSAKIYAFPAKGSLADTRTRNGGRIHKELVFPANAVVGSAWYHDVAIAETEPESSGRE